MLIATCGVDQNESPHQAHSNINLFQDQLCSVRRSHRQLFPMPAIPEFLPQGAANNGAVSSPTVSSPNGFESLLRGHVLLKSDGIFDIHRDDA